jgi:hypothetical protein
LLLLLVSEQFRNENENDLQHAPSTLYACCLKAFRHVPSWTRYFQLRKGFAYCSLLECKKVIKLGIIVRFQDKPIFCDRECEVECVAA